MRFALLFCLVTAPAIAQVRVGTFDVDASPPVGSPLAYDPTKAITEPLSCRGIVILGADKPIVLCSVDWLGIANESHREFTERLAKAAGTTPDRVSVHTIHQHDAPRCDFSAKELLDQVGLGDKTYDEGFCRSVFIAAAKAVAQSVQDAKPVTHIGMGQAEVKEVASNRRILGDDGKVKVTRYTACRDPKIRTEPVGTIDPMLKTISFWNEDKPVAVLSYYATHPQSYYRTGEANPDFPGMARNARQEELGVPHIHFNGAGGNIGAGKWNDGSKENRQVLADKVELGMTLAWEATKKTAFTAKDISWRTEPVQLPPGKHLVEENLLTQLKDETLSQPNRLTAAKHLAWLKRTESKRPVLLSCLQIGDARILHMPGELFVEYQLAAQKMQWRKFVAMAAYGEYGPGYIGTRVAYSQGGYETSERASRVSGEVEATLIPAIEKLLKPMPKQVKIHGEIYDDSDEADLEAIEGVLIRVFVAEDQVTAPREIARTTTNADGEYELTFRLPEDPMITRGEHGTVLVVATHPGYASVLKAYFLSNDPRYNKSLQKWDDWGMYRVNRTLRGTVCDPSGTPISGAVVHNEQNPNLIIPGARSVTTNQRGEFERTDLHSHHTPEEEQPIAFAVTHPNFGTQWIKVRYDKSETHRLRHPARLKGSVVDSETQKPLPNAIVWVLCGSRYHIYTKTDSLGKYSVLLDAGTYDISCGVPGATSRKVTRKLAAGKTGTLLPIARGTFAPPP